MREPLPAAPHISIVSVPQPGDVQHHKLSLLIQVAIAVGLTTQTLPFSRLFWLAVISLVDNRSDSFGIISSDYGPMNTQPNVAPEYIKVTAALLRFKIKSSVRLAIFNPFLATVTGFVAKIPATSMICIVSPSLGEAGSVRVNDADVAFANMRSPASTDCDVVTVLFVTLSVPKDDTCRPILYYLLIFYNVEVSMPKALADTFALLA